MPTFQELFGDVTEGAGDVTRAGITDVQNKYQEFLTARPAPMTAPTGEMELSTGPQEAQPQSMGAALREHSNMEQAEIRAKHEAAQLRPQEPLVAPPASDQPGAASTGPTTPQGSGPSPQAAPQGMTGETLPLTPGGAPWPAAFERLASHHVMDAACEDISGQNRLNGPPSHHHHPAQEDTSHEPEV